MWIPFLRPITNVHFVYPSLHLNFLWRAYIYNISQYILLYVHKNIYINIYINLHIKRYTQRWQIYVSTFCLKKVSNYLNLYSLWQVQFNQFIDTTNSQISFMSLDKIRKYEKVQIAEEEKSRGEKYISLWSSNYQITQLKLELSYLKTRLSRVSSVWNVI